jgi:hypothetical protein
MKNEKPSTVIKSNYDDDDDDDVLGVLKHTFVVFLLFVMHRS